MRVMKSAAALVFALGLAAPQLASAADATGELIVNGGFEQDVANGRYQVLPAIVGWFVGPLGVEVQTSAIFLPYNGNQYIELDTNLPKGNDGPSNSYIYQDVTTLPGRVYTLSLAYAVRTNSPDNGINVSLGGRVTEGGLLLEALNGAGPVPPTQITPPAAPLNWTLHSWDFKAASTTVRVCFEDTSPSNPIDRKGGLIDEVSMKVKPLVVSDINVMDRVAQGGSTIHFAVKVGTDGVDLSSPALVLKAVKILPTGVAAKAPGNNSLFFTLVDGVYYFDLKTSGLPAGNYQLGFTAGDDPTLLTVPFSLK